MQLFVYGVLIRELARGRATELIAPLGPARPATVRGTLHAVPGANGGCYPALFPDPAGGEVHGRLHEAGGVDWAALDEFEDAHDGPEAEYRRLELPVLDPTGGEETRAQVYCYARALPEGCEPIAHGDFARWLGETGRIPISTR